MYRKDLALNKPQRLKGYKTQQQQKKKMQNLC